jgi:hypothetical protein
MVIWFFAQLGTNYFVCIHRSMVLIMTDTIFCIIPLGQTKVCLFFNQNMHCSSVRVLSGKKAPRQTGHWLMFRFLSPSFSSFLYSCVVPPALQVGSCEFWKHRCERKKNYGGELSLNQNSRLFFMFLQSSNWSYNSDDTVER